MMFLPIIFVCFANQECRFVDLPLEPTDSSCEIVAKAALAALDEKFVTYARGTCLPLKWV